MLPPVRLHDLAVLDAYLPPGLQLRIDGGSADLSAELSFDTTAGSGEGRLALDARGVSGTFGDAAFTTDLTLRAASPALDLLAGRFDVGGSRLALSSARLVRGGRERAAGWSGAAVVLDGGERSWSVVRPRQNHTRPFLRDSGGELVFLGDGGRYLIGPPDERWELVNQSPPCCARLRIAPRGVAAPRHRLCYAFVAAPCEGRADDALATAGD